MSKVWFITGAGSGIGAGTATAHSKRFRAQTTCTIGNDIEKCTSFLRKQESRWQIDYRGRDSALDCAAPPSEPDWRISRIRLSGWWFYLMRTGARRDGLLPG
jgi:NAD(P)-dependent dehydrogenase (short-subunit alcohol dehydrogenase family)